MSSSAIEAPVNPLAAAYCADRAAHVRTPRDRERPTGPRHLSGAIGVPGDCPSYRAWAVSYGGLPETDDPLLGRPLALYDTWLDESGSSGRSRCGLPRGRSHDAAVGRVRPGDSLEIWGPLGNGFSPTPTEHLVMVAGGIGQTPFLALGASIWAGGATAIRCAAAPRATQVDALLRRPHCGPSGRRRRLSARGRRMRVSQRRWQRRPARAW